MTQVVCAFHHPLDCLARRVIQWDDALARLVLAVSNVKNALAGGALDVPHLFEIDVPTPPPDIRDKTPAVEFTAASSLLGSSAENGPDPDTGSRTPPIERRSS